MVIKDEVALQIFQLTIWRMHKALLTRTPRIISEEGVKFDAEAIWEMKGHINDFAKKKSLRGKLNNKMIEGNNLFNDATALAHTIITIYNQQDQIGTRILHIYQLCDRLKDIFDLLEGEDRINPVHEIKCSFRAIININYTQEKLIDEKEKKLLEAEDIIKFCFCKSSIFRWHRQLKKGSPSLVEEAKILLFEEAITDLKAIIECLHYGASLEGVLLLGKINELLNKAASQIGEVVAIYKVQAPTAVRRRLWLFANFVDTLDTLYEHLNKEKVSCPKNLGM